MYESAYGADKPLTGAQKLAEMACVRVASKDGRHLGDKFWSRPEWSGVFATQIRHANALLKLYDVQAIMEAWRDTPRVYSLGASWFVDHVLKAQVRIDGERTRAKESSQVERTDTTKAPKQGIKRGGGLRSKLT